jgi:thymidylate synthase (FAD)
MTDSYDIEVKLLAVTPDAEKLIERAGRLCWDTQDKTGTVPDRIQKWMEVGHESMVEHACATFYIRASRVLTHELVRHRQFEETMAAAWQAYRDLLAKGVKAEIARYVLPNACETQIICTWNFREIRHIIKLRTSKRALPEFRAVAEEIRRIAKEMAPEVFVDL